MEGESFSELAMSHFLTETQAAQGALTNGMNRVSYGKYGVGSESGNILVFDRSVINMWFYNFLERSIN